MKFSKKHGTDGSGLYRLFFTLSIFVLCSVTLLITDNNKNNDVKTVQNKIESKEKVRISDDEIKKIVDNLAAKSDSDEIKEDNSLMQPEKAQPEKTYSFSPPVYGTVAKEYSIDVPLYSETLDDWRPHRGIDIVCPYESEVTACEEGFVSKVGYDINFGNYVIVESGDYTCKYTSLSSDIKVYEGQYIYKGQVISYVTDSCVSEICDPCHLHLEMTYKGEYINPVEYIYFG